MSLVQVGGVDLCDNLSNPEALAAQTRNLNETNTLAQTQSLSPSQNEDGAGRGFLKEASLSNSGKDMEKEQGKEGYTGRGREDDEEEDIDEVMKEEEEEEESEGSSCVIRCQSPDTPMTDSSYSETGREHYIIYTHRHTLSHTILFQTIASYFLPSVILFLANWGSITPQQANNHTAECIITLLSCYG